MNDNKYSRASMGKICSAQEGQLKDVTHDDFTLLETTGG